MQNPAPTPLRLRLQASLYRPVCILCSGHPEAATPSRCIATPSNFLHFRTLQTLRQLKKTEQRRQIEMESPTLKICRQINRVIWT